jgi:hypothetical protein
MKLLGVELRELDFGAERLKKSQTEGKEEGGELSAKRSLLPPDFG